MKASRIAVVGDVHLCFDARDARALDEAGYDLVLFVGDLSGYRPEGGVEVARHIARLRTPALVLPGNHDAVTAPQLAAEVFGAPEPVRAALAMGMQARVAALEAALGAVPLVGYGLHRFEALGLTVVAGRPHSQGGGSLAYRHYLASRFGVRSLDDSAARLIALFDSAPADEPIVVLAHCGPSGLGASRADIYGCDFRPEEGDFGDPDLAVALAHARATGKRVRAVVAGHMHHRLRGGGERKTSVVADGVTHANAARVPRVRARGEVSEAHHVALTISDAEVLVEERWLPR